MISRHWNGIAKPEHADDYICHLKTVTFSKLAGVPGFIRASILRRTVQAGVEFQIVTVWRSMDDIKAFAGADTDVAVVPPLVQKLMASYDPKAVHYEIADTFER